MLPPLILRSCQYRALVAGRLIRIDRFGHVSSEGEGVDPRASQLLVLFAHSGLKVPPPSAVGPHFSSDAERLLGVRLRMRFAPAPTCFPGSRDFRIVFARNAGNKKPLRGGLSKFRVDLFIPGRGRTVLSSGLRTCAIERSRATTGYPDDPWR